jgi:response regulator of citrate/malate metabolism
MKEKHISPSEALKVGIKTMLEQPFELQRGEKILQETWKAKAEHIQHSMQACIDELNRKIDILEADKLNNGIQ